MDRQSSRQKGIDLDRARELIARGLTVTDTAKVLGCSRANIIQRLAAVRKRIAAAEETGCAARGRANTPKKSGRVATEVRTSDRAAL
jgi:hypothetical protein